MAWDLGQISCHLPPGTLRELAACLISSELTVCLTHLRFFSAAVSFLKLFCLVPESTTCYSFLHSSNDQGSLESVTGSQVNLKKEGSSLLRRHRLT